MSQRHLELPSPIDQPPAAEIAPGMCVVNTWESMLNSIGVNADAYLLEARQRRTLDMEQGRILRVDHLNRRLSKLGDDTDPLQLARIDQKLDQTVAASVRLDGIRIKQLLLSQLAQLKASGLLPEDAALRFETADIFDTYGLTRRDRLVGVRIMFTLLDRQGNPGRKLSHMFHLGVGKAEPYWQNLSDQPGSGIYQAVAKAIEENRLDEFLHEPAALAHSWNVVAFYPGLENVRRRSGNR